MVKTPTMASTKNETKDALIDFWLRRAALHKSLTCSSGLILVLYLDTTNVLKISHLCKFLG